MLEKSVYSKVIKIVKKSKKNIFVYCKMFPLLVRAWWNNFFGNGAIFVQAWVDSGTIINFKKKNWGDDLNKYLLEKLTKKKVIFIPKNFDEFLGCRLPQRFFFIGSILTFYGIDNAVICGTGIKNPNFQVYGKPAMILSVRGPKTRQVLLEQNIYCPEKYGDPALLLPLIYHPATLEIRDNIVLIVNESTIDDCEAVKTAKKLGFLIINMNKYNKWTEIIDIIVTSKFVISESLHGLIVAETYGIPNVWVELIEHPDWWSFKYTDFYESIKKYREESIKLYKEFNVNIIMDKVKNWQQGYIDYNKMLETFPFDCFIER